MPSDPLAGLPPFAQESLQKAPSDSEGLRLYPTLMQCLMPVWKDGKCLRQSGGLRLRIVGGYYLLTIHCPTEGVEATLTAETLVDMLAQLEQSLQLHQLRWFPDFERQKKTRSVKLD